MLERILAWLREKWKMLNSSDVSRRLNVTLPINTKMDTALRLWKLMYENNSPWLSSEIKSLNLAAAISGEVARLITLEMEIDFSKGGRGDFLKAQIAPIIPILRQQVEYGAAKGGLMMKPYVTNDGRILVDFIQADQFYPVTFNSTGQITACVFVDQRTSGQNVYTRLEYHSMLPDQKGCLVINQVFKSESRDTLGFPVSFTVVDDWAKLEPESVITGIDRPLFAYFKYPLSNSIDPASPLGVSCYSRAVGLIEDADKMWSDFLWEFESGSRALYVDELSFGKDSEGKPKLPHKRLYRALAQSGVVGKEDLFHEWSPEYREQSLLRGLDAILRRIEFTSGLAYGTLSTPQMVDKTATEMKISQQRSYSTVVDSQKALQHALVDLIWAMDMWATLANLSPAGAYEVVYKFDDSIIVDKESQLQRDLLLLGSLVISRVEFRMRNFGESEEAAKKMLSKVEMPETEPAPEN